MSTKAEIIQRLGSLPDDAVIAVPSIWVKESAEDLYEYANDEELTLSDTQWKEVVERFENAEFYDDEAMIATIDEVLELEKE